MIVVAQCKGTLIPFKENIFTACNGKIIVHKDIMVEQSEIQYRFIATYNDNATAKKVLKDMVTRYTMGAPVYYLPCADEAEKL